MHLKQYCYLAWTDFAYFVPDNFVITLRNCRWSGLPGQCTNHLIEPALVLIPARGCRSFIDPVTQLAKIYKHQACLIWLGPRNSSNWLSLSTAVMMPSQTCVCVCVFVADARVFLCLCVYLNTSMRPKVPCSICLCPNIQDNSVNLDCLNRNRDVLVLTLLCKHNHIRAKVKKGSIIIVTWIFWSSSYQHVKFMLIVDIAL